MKTTPSQATIEKKIASLYNKALAARELGLRQQCAKLQARISKLKSQLR